METTLKIILYLIDFYLLFFFAKIISETCGSKIQATQKDLFFFQIKLCKIKFKYVLSKIIIQELQEITLFFRLNDKVVITLFLITDFEMSVFQIKLEQN